jgi:hypothetical protein
MTDLVTDLTALSAYQKYATGTTTLHTILAKNLLAVQSTEPSPEETVLTLGSTGEVHFTVRGVSEVGKMFVDDNDILNFTSSDALWLTGSDADNTVGVSRTVFKYEAGTATNRILAGSQTINGELVKKNFEFDAMLSEFTGSVHARGDALVNGDILSRSVNIFKTTDVGGESNVTVGFGFRITDRNGLELYKYDSNSSYTQRIVTFGEGDVHVNDSYYDYPIFASNTSDYAHIFSGRHSGTGIQLWESDGANIFYNDGRVCVGDSNTLELVGSEYTLCVEKELFTNDGILVGANGIHIQPTQITNVGSVSFSNTNVTFDGTLSSLKLDAIVNDATNETWLRNQQIQVPLSGFNNDMHLDDFYTGSSRTWFDISQESISLNDFNKEGFVLSNVTFTSNGVTFSGEISELNGISSFGLTNFVDDIVTKSNLRVEDLSVGVVSTSIVPSSSSTLFLGSSNSTFNTVYVDSIQLTGDSNIGSIQYDSNTESVHIKGGILFDDGSKLTSANLAGASASRLTFADFEDLCIYAYENEAYQVNGKFLFNSNQQNLPVEETNKVYIYLIENGTDSNNINQLLFDSEGQIDLQNMVLRDVSSNAFIDILLVDEIGEKETGKFYVAPFSRQTAQEFVNLNVYIPNTEECNSKFFTDFQYFFNDYLIENPMQQPFNKYLPYGFSTGQTIDPEYTLCVLHTDITKNISMIMQYNTFYNLPFVPADLTTLDQFENAYFFDEDIENRLNGKWYYKKLETFGNQSEYVLYNESNYRLFPNISFRRWKNVLNQMRTLAVTPYVTALNWFDGSNINVSQFPEATLRNLFDSTVRYLKYGNAYDLTQNDQDEISQYLSSNPLTSDDFVVRTELFNGKQINNSLMLNPSIFSVEEGVLSF